MAGADEAAATAAAPHLRDQPHDENSMTAGLFGEYYATRPVRAPKHFFGLFTDSEVLAMVVYPVTLLLGQLVAWTTPEGSYFSDKKNIFNIVFVKQGWLWTTLAFGVNAFYIVRSRSGKTASTFTLVRQAVARYIVATLWWVIFAQWLFGMPLMDRVFLWTGGSCSAVSNDSAVHSLAELGPGPHHHLSSAMCRALGGQWLGGYDPSGHIFILTHGSLLVWFEHIPVMESNMKWPLPLGLRAVQWFLMLWWWMFLMTSVYFHSFGEKVTGLILGYVEVTFVYLIAEHFPLGKVIFGQE